MSSARLLRSDRRGVTVVEFSLVLPVLLVLMMGMAELAYESYVQQVLNGAVQKAARDSTIQGNSTAAQTAAIDAVVQQILKRVVTRATFPPATRTNYDTYGAIAGEPFTDTPYPANSTTYDGICNHGETYVDVNSNGKYDLDVGASGQGGANDVTKYTFTVSYPRLFPAGFLGLSNQVVLRSSTLLKNQPYQTQSVNSGTAKGNCP